MTGPAFQPRRSLIFAPGNRPDMYPKARASGADLVCLDLEDAIAPEDKDAARDKTLALFAELADGADTAAQSVESMVRINGLRSADGLADLLAICRQTRPPGALMVPKVKAPEEIRLLEELLDGAGHDGVRFHIIIETAAGLECCREIAGASRRIDSLLFGGVDMAAELRVDPTWQALLYARSRLVPATADAGIDLIDVPYLDLDDMAGLEREAAAVAALGYTGKAAIHPKQIAAINGVFTPSRSAIEEARCIVAAFEAGSGGLVVVDNKLIEKPVLRSCYRIIALAAQTDPA